jgi:hypothetical protein
MLKKDYDAALSDLRESLAIEESLGNRVGMASDYDGIGQVFLRKARAAGPETRDQWLREAEINFRKAYKISEGLDRRLAAIILDNLGEWASESGNSEAARDFWSRSRDLHQDLGLEKDKEGVERQLDKLPLISDDENSRPGPSQTRP